MRSDFRYQGTNLFESGKRHLSFIAADLRSNDGAINMRRENELLGFALLKEPFDGIEVAGTGEGLDDRLVRGYIVRKSGLLG